MSFKQLEVQLEYWPLSHVHKFFTERPDIELIKQTFLELGLHLIHNENQENSLVFLTDSSIYFDSCKIQILFWSLSLPLSVSDKYLVEVQRLYGSHFLFYEIIKKQSLI